jgi:predicted dehydrogenase
VRAILPALATNPRYEVIAVCAAHQERAAEIASQFSVPTATTEFRRAIEMDDVEMVFLCGPPPMHGEMIHCALDAGRHIFSTKPLATSLADARAVAGRARELGVVTAMDFSRRYIPARRYLRQLFREGYIGEPRFVSETVFVGNATHPDGELYYWNWVAQREQYGGILRTSLVNHHLDLLRYTFGELYETAGMAATVLPEKPLRPEDAPVGSPGDHLGPTGGQVNTEDAVSIHGRLDNGSPFSLNVTWSVHFGSGYRVEAYGDRGTLVLEPSGRIMGARLDDHPLHELTPPPEYSLPRIGVDTVPQFIPLTSDVYAAVRNQEGEGLFATFADGLRLCEISEPILRAFYARDQASIA